MKALLLSLILILPVLLSAQSQRISSDIQSVKVHLQGAEIIRTVEVDLKAGRQKLIFEQLSPKLYPKSIQVTTGKKVRILSVVGKQNYLQRQEANPAIEALRDSVQQLRRQLSAINNQLAANQAGIDLLRSNQDLQKEQNPLSVERLETMTAFYQRRMLAIYQENSQLQVKLEQVHRRLLDSKLQLQELNEGRQASSEVELLLDVPQATKVPIQLRYVVADAGWAPAYDLEAPKLSASITLRYRGLAYNNTGVDWENVKLSLSTADPLQSATQPRLEIWDLADASSRNLNAIAELQMQDEEQQMTYQQQNQQYSKSSMNKNRVKEILGEDYNEAVDYRLERYRDLESDRRASDQQVSSMEIEVPELSTDFIIEEKQSIPADKKPYYIDIKTAELNAQYKYLSIPKIDSDAFLLARVTGWEDLDLVNGPVHIFNQNRYIGQSYLDIRNLSDTLDISLGRDPSIVVTRDKVQGDSKNTLLGNSRKVSAKYVINVRNNHSEAIPIEIRDQVPISNDKDISVEITELGGADLEQSSGLMSWTQEIPAKGNSSFSFGFSIKYPKGREVRVQYQKTRKMKAPRF